MAKISVEFDTVEKTMSCTMNGDAVANVVGCSFYRGYGSRPDYACEIMTAVESEDDDLRTYTRLVASDTAEGKSLARQGAEAAELEGFVVAEGLDAATEREVLSFFGKAQ